MKKLRDSNTIPTKELQQLLRYHEGKLFWLARYGNEAGTLNNRGYVHIQIKGKKFLRSRLVYAMHTGVWPEEIDHINRDRRDDRIENLRAADREINNRNTSAKGYYWDRGKWVAYIRGDGQQRHLGRFNTESEAQAARKEGKLRYWGIPILCIIVAACGGSFEAKAQMGYDAAAEMLNYNLQLRQTIALERIAKGPIQVSPLLGAPSGIDWDGLFGRSQIRTNNDRLRKYIAGGKWE